MKTWEKISARVRELPPEKQQQVLDFVEFLRTRGGGDLRASDPGAPASLPEVKFGPEEDARRQDTGRFSAADYFLTPPPRRHAAPVILGLAFLVAVLAVGGFLYYRYVWMARSSSDEVRTRPTTPGKEEAVVAAATRGATDEKPTAGTAVGDDAEKQAMARAVTPRQLTPGADPDAGAPAAPAVAQVPPPDAGPAASGGEAATAARPDRVLGRGGGTDCSAALGQARKLWDRGQREEALQKLREAIACDPSDIRPPLQWGRWFMDFPSSLRHREAVREGAAFLGTAAEANPHHAELWFHYTNLLFGSGQNEAAQKARQHCMAIRPSNDYTESCRLLPQ